jgi:hypothetical protein
MEIGIVGKPNVGKSTLFSALTMVDVPIANYPFTTIDSHVGIGHVRISCVCREFGVEDNPKNSICIDGIRFIPVKIIDTAGLVPDAWKGRGLGNRFLNKISMADALIHVIDASGSTDIEGRPVSPGTHDPLDDIAFLRRELVQWVLSIVKKHWDAVYKSVSLLRRDPVEALEEKLSGLKFSRGVISEAYKTVESECGHLPKWNDECIKRFTELLLDKGKPMVIAANKIDFPYAEENIKRIREAGYDVIPISAVSELVLKKLVSQDIIRYLPGDSSFEIIKRDALDEKRIKALDKINQLIFEKYGGTGVQPLINHVVFDVLDYIVVYPVRDPNRLSDKDGNILPDAYLVPKGTTLKDFAYIIHTDVGKSFLYGLDVRKKLRLKGDYVLKNGDVVSIVSSQ